MAEPEHQPRRRPLLLSAYAALANAATPLGPSFLERRARAGKEHPDRLREKLGEPNKKRPEGRLIWLHGASIGESLSLIPLIARITAIPNTTCLVTTGTVTSAAVLEDRLPENAIHQFVPLDLPRALTRFLDHWRPQTVIFAESEIWPNMIAAISDRGIPLAIVNGRLSKRSARNWAKLPSLASAIFSRFDVVLAQSEADAERFRKTGARRVSTVGNLKFDAVPPSPDRSEIARCEDAIKDRTVFLALSTHPGEEEHVLSAHKVLRESMPELLTILMPRHPERGHALDELARSHKTTPICRSNGGYPARKNDIWIFDTVGEMGLVLSLGNVAFMGGTLVAHGGQNPIEPAREGVALIHGPSVFNFSDIVSRLNGAGAAMAIHDAMGMAEAVKSLLNDDARRREQIARAKEVVSSLSGATDRTFDDLRPFLVPSAAAGT